MYEYMVINYIQLFSPNRVWVKSFVFVVDDLGPAGLQTFLDKLEPKWLRHNGYGYTYIYIYIYDMGLLLDCYLDCY